MDTVFPDYQKLVIEYYQWKKSHHKLRSELRHPTRAKLKKECVRLCRGKVQRKDEKVIRDFCEDWDEKKTYLQNIGNYDVDKFKPLSNFLQGNSDSTDPKNIELLAWLIDFKARPYDFDKDYSAPLVDFLAIWGEVQDNVYPVSEPFKVDGSLTVEGESNAGENFGDGVESDSSRGNKVSSEMPEKARQTGTVSGGDAYETFAGAAVDIEKVKPKLGIRRSVVVGVLLFVIVTGGYWWWDIKSGSDGGCMYWADDHYEPIPCNQKVPNKLVRALDTEKVKNFRKITRSDTITYRAKGWVWYSKIDNEFEYFTADGEHPVVYGRRLKPITDYIINKHIRPDVTSSQ